MSESNGLLRSTKIERDEHDEAFGVKKTMNYESDGFSAVAQTSELVSRKKVVVIDGTTTTIYLGIAPIGTLQTATSWQCKKTVVDSSVAGTTIITDTWADGNANFDNAVNNITGLTYA